MQKTMSVDRARLRRHIEQLTATTRPAQTAELEAAQRYVAGLVESSGWLVERQEFTATTDQGETLAGVNLVARRRGGASGRGRLCVGAHLDSRPESPGADDNASGVAVLLEAARILNDDWPPIATLDLELVFFDLEENGMLGGAHHAAQARRAAIDLRGMVSLEMLGYCSHAPQSQALPRALAGLYPDVGNFIAVVGNQNSGRLIEAFSAGLRRVAGLPVETLQVPANGDYLQATRLSDHSPFWDAGYAALMITDTSFLRNPHYHLPSDTVETLDFDFLELVGQGCCEAIRSLIAAGL